MALPLLNVLLAFVRTGRRENFEVMSNPFSRQTEYQADQQRMRRERVKITFYAIVGTLVVFCLALLFQGCQHHEPATENPISGLPASHVSQDLPTVADVPGAITSSNSEPVPPPVPTVARQTSPAPALADLPESKSLPIPASTHAETLYVIKRGDSLATIAKANRTTVKALKAANGLTSDLIRIGQKLKIPAVQS